MKFTVIMIGMLTTLCAVPLSAQDPVGLDGPGRGRPDAERLTTGVVDRMAKHLNLSDEQKQKVQKIASDTKGDMERLARESRDRLQKSQDDIAALLNPEQKEKFDKMRQQLKERRGGPADRGAQAERGHRRQRGAGAERLGRLEGVLGKMDLTEGQKKELKQLKSDLQERVKSGGMERAGRRGDMRQEIQKIQRELKSILSPEQMKELRQKFASGPKGRRDGAGRTAMRGGRGGWRGGQYGPPAAFRQQRQGVARGDMIRQRQRMHQSMWPDMQMRWGRLERRPMGQEFQRGPWMGHARFGQGFSTDALLGPWASRWRGRPGIGPAPDLRGPAGPQGPRDDRGAGRQFRNRGRAPHWGDESSI